MPYKKSLKAETFLFYANDFLLFSTGHTKKNGNSLNLLKFFRAKAGVNEFISC
jgi:hypothetical protein